MCSRALFRRRERGQREVFVLVAEEEDLLLRARGWVFCARERERDFGAFVVEKLSPYFGSRGIIIIIICANLLSIASSARTFKKRREKEKNECIYIYIYIISMGRSLSSSRENNNGQHGEKSSLLSSSGRDQNGKGRAAKE